MCIYIYISVSSVCLANDLGFRFIKKLGKQAFLFRFGTCDFWQSELIEAQGFEAPSENMINEQLGMP